LINATRKKVGEALKSRDSAFFEDLARRQDEAGADIIDVNAGADPATELDDMKWAVSVVQAATDKPLAIDSPDPEVVRAGLEIYTGDQQLMVNSITLEPDRFEPVAAIVAEAGTQVIALAMTESGMPCSKDERVEAAQKLIDGLTERGIPPERIFVDPVVTPVSTMPDVGPMMLDAIAEIREYSPEGHVTCGLSNVSYGLPERKLLNRVFLCAAMGAGLDSAILDPLDAGIMATVLAAEALLGHDEFCMEYVMASREGKLTA
jgi:5-methyltetrahydrofolate--homocysteine methyltransferase